MGVRAWAASSKGTVSPVLTWFRANSGTNLIKQGEIVAGRPCGSVAQWSECSHGMREVLGSSPGQAVYFFLPCDTNMPIVSRHFTGSSNGHVISKYGHVISKYGNHVTRPVHVGDCYKKKLQITAQCMQSRNKLAA